MNNNVENELKRLEENFETLERKYVKLEKGLTDILSDEKVDLTKKIEATEKAYSLLNEQIKLLLKIHDIIKDKANEEIENG